MNACLGDVEIFSSRENLQQAIGFLIEIFGWKDLGPTESKEEESAAHIIEPFKNARTRVRICSLKDEARNICCMTSFYPRIRVECPLEAISLIQEWAEEHGVHWTRWKEQSGDICFRLSIFDHLLVLTKS